MRSTATQGELRRGREIDVGETVVHPVGGTVVARSGADSNAEHRRILKGAVQGLHSLFGPIHFGIAPADRDDRRFVLGIMNGAADSIDEPRVRVRREVDVNLCLWSYAPDDLDVEHDLGIGTVRVSSGRVAGPVD